jgi:hypothetical protein
LKNKYGDAFIRGNNGARRGIERASDALESARREEVSIRFGSVRFGSVRFGSVRFDSRAEETDSAISFVAKRSALHQCGEEVSAV